MSTYIRLHLSCNYHNAIAYFADAKQIPQYVEAISNKVLSGANDICVGIAPNLTLEELEGGVRALCDKSFRLRYVYTNKIVFGSHGSANTHNPVVSCDIYLSFS